MMLPPSFVGLMWRLTLREMVQGEDAGHADDHGGRHDLHHGPVLEQKLADEDVIGADAALLQEEAEGEPEDDALDDDARGR